MPELLTLPEAAEYLRAYSIRSLHPTTQVGAAVGLKVGRKIVYRVADLHRYLDDQLAAPECRAGEMRPPNEETRLSGEETGSQLSLDEATRTQSTRPP